MTTQSLPNFPQDTWDLLEEIKEVRDPNTGKIVGLILPTTHNGAPIGGAERVATVNRIAQSMAGASKFPESYWPGVGTISGIQIPSDQNGEKIRQLLELRDARRAQLGSPGADRGRAAVDGFVADGAPSAGGQSGQTRTAQGQQSLTPDQAKEKAAIQARRELAAIGVPHFDTVPGSNGTNIPVGQMTQDGREKLKAYLKRSGLPVGEGMSKTSGEVITIYGRSPDSPEVRDAVDAQRKVNGSHAGTPHASPPSGARTSFSKQAGLASPGLLGRVAVAAVAVVGAIAGGKANASEVIDHVIPGANVSGEKPLCRAWGEVAGVGVGVAAGIVTAPVVTPVGGVAVGLAVDTAAGKLTDLVCGPS